MAYSNMWILGQGCFGSLGINFGIKDAVIHVLWAIKVCAFWSHNCQLRHQVDIFRKKSSLRDNNSSFYKYFGQKRTVCVILKPCISSTIG